MKDLAQPQGIALLERMIGTLVYAFVGTSLVGGITLLGLAVANAVLKHNGLQPWAAGEAVYWLGIVLGAQLALTCALMLAMARNRLQH